MRVVLEGARRRRRRRCPRIDPIERSTLRVMITIVSPIARRAMIAAPESSCCRLVVADEVGVVDRRHARRRSRARARCRARGSARAASASACERAAASTGRRRRARRSSLTRRPPRVEPGRGAHDRVLVRPPRGRTRAETRPSKSTIDAVGHAEHLGQLRRDHQHRHALAGELGEQPVHLGLRADVDPARRLVDDQQRRAAARATSPARPSAGCRPRASRPGSSAGRT